MATIPEINKMLRNPAEIHIIQDKLLAIEGKTIFAEAIKIGAKNNIGECIKMILSQAKDNRVLVAHIVGECLLSEIENFAFSGFRNSVNYGNSFEKFKSIL